MLRFRKVDLRSIEVFHVKLAFATAQLTKRRQPFHSSRVCTPAHTFLQSNNALSFIEYCIKHAPSHQPPKLTAQSICKFPKGSHKIAISRAAFAPPRVFVLAPSLSPGFSSYSALVPQTNRLLLRDRHGGSGTRQRCEPPGDANLNTPL